MTLERPNGALEGLASPRAKRVAAFASRMRPGPDELRHRPPRFGKFDAPPRATKFSSGRSCGIPCEPERGFARHPSEAFLVETRRDSLCWEPPDLLRLRNLSLDRLVVGYAEQESDVVVFVSRLVRPAGDFVHIDVEDLRTRRDGDRLEAPQSGFLLGLAQRRDEHIGLPIRVPPELKPSLEFSVMRQEHGAALV